MSADAWLLWIRMMSSSMRKMVMTIKLGFLLPSDLALEKKTKNRWEERPLHWWR